MTVGEMLSKMSAFEYSMWMVYSKVDNERMEEARNPKKIPDDIKQEMAEQQAVGFLEKKGVKARKLVT